MENNAVKDSSQTELLSGKPRFWELDFVRGICVILMVLDHMMYSIMGVMPMVDAMLGKTVWENISLWVADVYWYNPIRINLRFMVLGAFFMICGISCTLSRSNLKRGGMCFLIGCGLTFATVIIDKIFSLGISIYFGVLHMLGASMLLYAGLSKLGSLIAKIGKQEKTLKVTKIIGDYLAPTVGLILLIIYFACFNATIEGDSFTTDVLIQDKSMSVLASLFINVDYTSLSFIIGGSDYWPLFPWASIVLMGGFIGVGLYRSKAKNYLSRFDGRWNKPICFVGRHALFVYVAHQVAVVLLLFLITLLA